VKILKNLVKLISVVGFFAMLNSCMINSNMMFKTPKDGSFVYDSIPLKPKEDYKLSIDDKLVFTLSTNNGKNLIEGITGTSAGVNGGQMNSGGGLGNHYIIRSNGYVELPVLGDLYLEGLTIKQCEDTLEYLFQSQYQDPFVQLQVTNRRCVVFSGDGSAARIVNLQNINTTLLEILAQTGGISQRGKSKIVKVMRKVGDKREIYHIDVSTIDGLKYADMIIQGNDYIYVEPRPQIIQGALKEWAPIASLASSVTLIFTILRYTN
jgi:polysaccharide biosynthesis/export protein